MRITGVTLSAVVVPYLPEVGTLVRAGLTQSETKPIILELPTSDQATGPGEAVPRPSVYGETGESITDAERDLLLAPMLGLDSLGVERGWARRSRAAGRLATKRRERAG